MKKLDVSKILMLMFLSVGLIACGQVKSDLSDAGLNSDSYSVKSVPRNEGGNHKVAPVDEGGNHAAMPEVSEEEFSPTDEGGNHLTTELAEGILYIKGSVDKEITYLGLIINGKEQYRIDVKDGFFEFKMELANEDFDSMSVHLVIGKEVKTFMVLKGELQEVKYVK